MPNNGKGGQQNPFDVLRNLGDLRDLKRILGPDFFKNLPMSGGEGGADMFGGSDDEPYPPIDMYDTGNEIFIWANIPGMNRTDISLQATPFNIVIRGHVPSSVPRRDERLLFDERYYGSFERDIELPARIQTDTVRAAYTNGVLKITVTKYAPSEDDFNQAVNIEFE